VQFAGCIVPIWLSFPTKNEEKTMSKNIRLLQGNEACAEGAILAGVRFFGGYPITPSTEIAEILARRLPLVDGTFMQMEDEIGSLAAVIGASVAGVKAMTATSGPGFSLMQEHIGYAYMAEVPCVIIDIQRGGPSTGLPTKVSQSDIMQAAYGTHGDYHAIVLSASSCEECLLFTIKAVNLAERYRTPVVLLADEVIGHMREKVNIPERDEVEVQERIKPEVPPEWYKHFEITPTFVSPMASFGEGYRFNITGLTHDEMGFPTAKPAQIKAKLDKLRKKIERNKADICEIKTAYMDDEPHIIVLSTGIVSRAANQAVKIARQKRMKVGAIQLVTLWPFPDKQIAKYLKTCRHLVVAELNQGQIVKEVERYVDKRHTRVDSLQRYDSELITPQDILQKIREVK
jgi:2-oxoglutarate ferredoxin oxidoreductase subunit alpha